ncbi:hypothetical protein PAPYR_12057 [Paratrimastix pyriformis]|uniref:Uncharacterized protein n=1 Tax=Paratrimastix pyriformis TaxID=342808 RepID=A0ABQ8U2J7_9EUKA|nr:hypothetical protein PAPYR_12057 [Paratrimastix pyriformis]
MVFLTAHLPQPPTRPRRPHEYNEGGTPKVGPFFTCADSSGCGRHPNTSKPEPVPGYVHLPPASAAQAGTRYGMMRASRFFWVASHSLQLALTGFVLRPLDLRPPGAHPMQERNLCGR